MTKTSLKAVAVDTTDLVADAKESVAKTAKEIANDLEPTYDELKAQVETLKADLAALAGTARKASRGALDVAKSKVSQARDALPAAVDRASDVINDQLTTVLEKTEDYVRTRPTTAIGLAVGAGFLFALMTAPRQPRR